MLCPANSSAQLKMREKIVRSIGKDVHRTLAEIASKKMASAATTAASESDPRICVYGGGMRG